MSYPEAARGDVVDDYHGTRIADPYRALEDPDAPETRSWIEAQNALTRAYIDAVPERAGLEARLSAVWNYERCSVPRKRAGRYVFTKNDGLQNQGVIYTTGSLDAPARVLLDPNMLRADGTIAVNDLRVSPDGKLAAYQRSESGSDWTTIRVRDIQTARDIGDEVAWVKFSSISWASDSRGFYYSTYPDHDTTGTVALKNHRLMFHALGSAAAEDTVVYARPDQPEWGFGGRVSDDGEVLLVSQSQGTEEKSRLFVADLRAQSLEFRPLFDRFDAEYEYLGKRGAYLYLRTDLDAPRSRIVRVDWTQATPNTCATVVPESSEAIASAHLAGGKIVIVYVKDAVHVVRVHALEGALESEVPLPGLGSVGEFHGELDDDEAFFSFSSFTTPSQVWRYDVATRACKVWRAPRTAFDSNEFTTEQLFFDSRDGTRVPLFVSRKKSTALSAATPTLLYGYGGFNISILPSFSPAMLVWMELGGAYVSVNLRGGGEYGREWHEAGTQARKQNVFDDFIGAAEFLIRKGWTSPAKLAIHGRSNGGLLVGACLTQRPDLFGACVPGVGVLDMLRYHRFTIGWAWKSDYGCADEAAEFPYLIAYSPLHNVKPGVRYPATLITTGAHDDRVVPAHSFKFAAELQHAQATVPDAPPILIRIETRGGHGAGKPTALQIEEFADVLAFLRRALGA
ncbi:MAG: S9 family peptidase [Planctomycetes bacterium]|nr:S9 family peptidase [Planctomycetota bacterium]